MGSLLLALELRCHQGIVVISRAHYTIAIIVSALILLSTAPAAAQQSVTDWVYGYCNTARFNSNETFADNFNAVVQSLTQNSSKTLYSTALSLSGSQSNYVHGFYQCRGDVSLSDCFSCVSNALSTTTTICGYPARGARAQYKGCYMRYESYNFSVFENDDVGGVQFDTSCDTSNDSSPVYQHNLATVLNITASAAPKHALFGYNASSVVTGSITAYALSQCVGYISPSECATCLSYISVSNYSRECKNSVSGGVYFVDCYYLYDNASFLFTYNNSTSTSTSANPPASPQRSLIVINPTQDQRSKEHSNSTTPIVVGTSLAIAVILTLALCYLKGTRKAAAKYKLAQGPSDNIYGGAGDELLAADQPGGRGATRFSLKELQ